MKQCNKCGHERKLRDFSFKYKKRNIRGTICKFCIRKYTKKHYKDNSVTYKRHAKKNTKRYRAEARDFIWEYLSTHPCVDCGESDPIVLEFDHIRDKRMSISVGTRFLSLKKLKEEIGKCAIRCANCHRRSTAKKLGWWKDKLKNR